MKKITPQERMEQIFMAATEAEARSLLELAGVIVRLRFPAKEAVRRARRAKGEVEPPLLAVTK